MRLYVVMAVKKEHEAIFEVGPDRRQMTVPVTLEWADGMVGVLAVFDNQKDAEAYAGDKYRVQMVQEVADGA